MALAPMDERVLLSENRGRSSMRGHAYAVGTATFESGGLAAIRTLIIDHRSTHRGEAAACMFCLGEL
jgi:hypothetical protein